MITGENIGRDVNTSRLNIWGGSNMTSGGRIILYGSDYTTSSDKGRITLQAFDGSENSLLTLYPSGTFTFNNNGTTKKLAMQEDVIPRSGGKVLNSNSFARNVDNDYLSFEGGSGYRKGARLTLIGKDVNTSEKGRFQLYTDDGTNRFVLYGSADGSLAWNGTMLHPSNDNSCSLGLSARRWSTIYAATGTINTSDSRLKNSVKDIDDKLLDAWENVEPKQYKFNDATEKKGEKARFHTGYLAQDIQTECEKQKINASDYGLFCYDEWEEQEEISEEIETEKDGKKVKEKHVIQPKREKGDAYSLRYEEALVVECAYLRREINKLKEELNQLKTK